MMHDNLTEEVAYYITERENIRIKKEKNLPRPWTKDSILDQYRFCNVRREDDAVTKWIAKHFRNDYYYDDNLPRALVLARMVNWPHTLANIGYPTRFDGKFIVKKIHEVEAAGKAWSSAYIVSTNGKRMDKAVYIVEEVARHIPPYTTLSKEGHRLETVHKALMKCNGLGSFMAAQIVADLKNTPHHPLEEAKDWHTWAAKGPGSIRGLQWYFGENGLSHGDFLANLKFMAQEVRPLLPPKLQDLCAQDWQNVMCEFDKYWRTKVGQGRPKSHYAPNPYFPKPLR